MSRIKVTIVGLYNFDESIFDDFTVPEGISKANLIVNILEKAGDFSLLYPDWDFMKMMVRVWSSNELPIWEKLYETTNLVYNPIENYDRYDTIERNSESSGRGTSVGSSTAFNTDDFKATGKTESDSSGEGTETVESHMHGNIGVTSSQELIEQQREVVNFNVYDYITRSFIERFCIELY